MSGRLAQHAESVRLDKKPTKDEWKNWFNESLGPALAKVGYDLQYVFNEDESGMFIDFDTGSLKVYVLRGTKSCAKRRGYDKRHVTLVACVRADGFYVRPTLLWPSALTRGKGVLNGKKKCSSTSFPEKARGHSMCSTMVGGSWRLGVGGGWRLAGGNWQLVAVGGGWRRLVAGGWWLEAVGSGWQLAVGRPWRT